MPNLRRVGREAEDRAADYLHAEGYTIVTRRFKSSRGEIDLIAMDGDVLVFVEVKERRTDSCLPEDGVGLVKLGHLRIAATEYIAKMELADPVARFDVVAIDRQGLRHYRNVTGED